MSRFKNRSIPASNLDATAIAARAHQADLLREAEQFRLLKAARRFKPASTPGTRS